MRIAKLFVVGAIGMTACVANGQENDLINTAKAVKAILEKGYAIPKIVDVVPVTQLSTPEKHCIQVIIDRKPNTKCPNIPGVGPNWDQWVIACFNPGTHEVDYSSDGGETQCPPGM